MFKALIYTPGTSTKRRANMKDCIVEPRISRTQLEFIGIRSKKPLCEFKTSISHSKMLSNAVFLL